MAAQASCTTSCSSSVKVDEKLPLHLQLNSSSSSSVVPKANATQFAIKGLDTSKITARVKPIDDQSPVHVLRDIFERQGISSPLQCNASSQKNKGSRFQRPSRDVMDAYDMDTCRAVRSGNLEQLKDLHQNQGRSLNGSNPFGESLLHMACRRGDLAVIQYMIDEANVVTSVQDDMGRNVFHDAFWTSQPNLKVMDVLLATVSPLLLLTPDVRGHTPFDYARQSHWKVWRTYLQQRAAPILERRLALWSSIDSSSTMEERGGGGESKTRIAVPPSA